MTRFGVRGQSLVTCRKRLEVRDAGINGLPAFSEDGGKTDRLVALHLFEMPDHVAKGDQPVFDVVVDLAGEVADGRAALGFADTRGARTKPGGKIIEETGETTDFVRAVFETNIEPIEVEDGSLCGKSSDRAADSGREPESQEKGTDCRTHGGHEKP